MTKEISERTTKRTDEKSGKVAGLAGRGEAVRLLNQVIINGQPLSDALAESPTALKPADRAMARAIVTTTLRHHNEISDWLATVMKKPLPKKSGNAQAILHTAAAQLMLMRIPAHAAIDQAVRIARNNLRAKHFSGLINAVLRQLTRTPPTLLPIAESARHNTPEWLWLRWQKTYGAELAGAICTAQMQQPPLDISLKTANVDWAEKLAGVELCTGSLRLEPGHGPIIHMPGFAEGEWWVQDGAARLPALLLGDIAGKTVLDLCAAPGGKTAQLCAANAKVTALDHSAPRLERLAENLRRLKLDAKIITSDVLHYDFAPYDAVLLDAPCTATGTIRRHPDALLLKSAKQLTSLSQIQGQMLTKAASLVKPGGLLVYCTCSLEPEEGEDQIAAFLASHSDFARVPVTLSEIGRLPDAITAHGDLRTLPCLNPGHQGGMDGFFAARLKRKS